MLPDHETKIVATIGPASESPEMLECLIRAGLNVARLNFSHSCLVPRLVPRGRCLGCLVPRGRTKGSGCIQGERALGWGNFRP